MPETAVDDRKAGTAQAPAFLQPAEQKKI